MAEWGRDFNLPIPGVNLDSLRDYEFAEWQNSTGGVFRVRIPLDGTSGMSVVVGAAIAAYAAVESHAADPKVYQDYEYVYVESQVD